ncbi:MAG: polyprenyl synthetase family protein [Nitrolancea sp.]
MDFTDVLATMRADLQQVEQRLRREVDVDFPFIGEVLDGLIAAGGKRLRPLILLLAARPFDYNLDRLLPAAAGVELLHTASLIHDDTVDHAEVRRGRPTLNTLISTEAVILFGDYIFARAAMLAAETMSPKVVGVFASTLGDICDGELREIFTARELGQSLDDYKRRIYGKTAALFAGSAEMGAILGEATDDEIAAMRRFGKNVGMAFQIVDDVLDLRESTNQIGKPAGLDLRQGTVTLPTMLFFEHDGNDGDKTEVVRRAVGGNGATDDDYAMATTVIRESGALERSLAVAARYVDDAKEELCFIPNGQTRDMLESLADQALNRSH